MFGAPKAPKAGTELIASTETEAATLQERSPKLLQVSVALEGEGEPLWEKQPTSSRGHKISKPLHPAMLESQVSPAG
jgi:hypothetical protein